MTQDNTTIIDPIIEDVADRNWDPVVGPEALAFLEQVPEASREGIEDTAVSILAKGISPNSAQGQETGLVVGYVQSGKTMSFETVASLARDNGFQIVIVVAGTSNNLLVQSTGRLRKDLRLDEPGRERRWVLLQNPDNVDSTVQVIRDVLNDWRDPSTPDNYKKTVLVTVLKHHQRLRTLTALFNVVGLENAPVLIIDDEADQASLNTGVAQGEESTTYTRLMNLRDSLPNHTFLQYTATPQAPLLISIIDSLSPNFVQVLNPGEDYVGGQEFFTNDHSLVRVIPPQEVSTITNPLSEPPDTLLDAIRIFMVGVTAGVRESGNTGNRSMLVHPSHRTSQHHEFYNWVRDIFEEWKRILNLVDTDPDKQELIEDFRDAYNDLCETVETDMPLFDELAPTFPLAFRNTRILEVNAAGGRTPEVDWLSAYGWILVGGQAMDRGFTIEGLTVTYMPRGIGVGNADTVQQRARFFGYKRSYIGYCRVYLEQGTLNAFQNYVDHEEDIRSQLIDFLNNNRPLNDWKRAFVLDTALRPCRHQVLEFDYMRVRISDSWVAPRVILASKRVVEANQNSVNNFIVGLQFNNDEGHNARTETQKHLVCKNVPLGKILEELLILIRITATADSQRYTGMLLMLSRALDENPNEVGTIYRISPTVRRERGIDENGEVTNIYQGAYPVNPRELRGTIYPGDSKIHENDNVTVQIHDLDLTLRDEVIIRNVPVIAVWVPARLGRSWIVQDQPDQTEG